MDSATPPHIKYTDSSLDRLGGATSCRDRLLETGTGTEPTADNLYSFPLTEHAPLGISLYSPANYAELLLHSPYSARHLVDGLLHELRLYSQRIQSRSIPWLSWRLPHALVDSADITELMYFLGRQCRLQNAPERRYSVSFACDELQATSLALFKGLGYNSLEVSFPEPTRLHLDALRQIDTLVNDFHFDTLQLSLSEPMIELPDTLRICKSRGAKLPDAVVLGQFRQNLENGNKFDQLFRGMRDLGYRVLGNDCFVSPESALGRAQNQGKLHLNCHGYNCQNVGEILGLGPGNFSSWGGHRRRNPIDLPAYLNHKPTTNRDLKFTSSVLQPVLDQLLCYHSLDLEYFRSHYRWNLLPVVRRAWSPLQCGDSQLYIAQPDTLSLTPEGILKLAELCCCLVSSLRDSGNP